MKFIERADLEPVKDERVVLEVENLPRDIMRISRPVGRN